MATGVFGLPVGATPTKQEEKNQLRFAEDLLVEVKKDMKLESEKPKGKRYKKRKVLLEDDTQEE